MKKNATLSLGKRFFYVLLPSFRKIGLAFCCAHLAYESSQETDLPMQSSIISLGIVVVVFVSLLFLDEFLERAKLFRQNNALENYVAVDVESSEDSGHRRNSTTEYSPLPNPNNGDNFRAGEWCTVLYRSSRSLLWILASIVLLWIILFLVAQYISPGIIWWLFQCLITLMFWILHDFTLVFVKSSSNDVQASGHIPSLILYGMGRHNSDVQENNTSVCETIRNFFQFQFVIIRGSFIRRFIQTVHIAMGVVIITPLYVLSLLPFCATLHNQMLFNVRFAKEADPTYHQRRVMSSEDAL